jgi:hypothetical protein
MATKSGFSKGWQGFVDHKWSKKVFALHSLARRHEDITKKSGGRAFVPKTF